MTIIIGLLCDGGVVIGADSSATMGAALTGRTIEQPTHKISVVDSSVIVAGTGAVGLNQRFVEIVKRLQAEGIFKSADMPHIEVGKRLAAEARRDFDATGAFKQRQDAAGVYAVCDYGALVAFWKHGKGHLLELEVGTLQPEFKSDEGLWWVSMGSGQPIVDPFLGLMSKAFCSTARPQLPIGRFITSWALNHAIELNVGGINAPQAIAVLSTEGGKQPVARLLHDEELQEHLAMVKAVYEHMGRFPMDFAAAGPEIPA